MEITVIRPKISGSEYGSFNEVATALYSDNSCSPIHYYEWRKAACSKGWKERSEKTSDNVSERRETWFLEV